MRESSVALSNASHSSDLMQESIATREEKLISEVRERGYVTFEEVQTLYPDTDEYLDAVDAFLVRLIEIGITPVSAASVKSVVKAIAVEQRCKKVTTTKAKAYSPLDLVSIYLEEIRQFSVLKRNQERWLGIVMECPELTIDNPGLGSKEHAKSWDVLFRRLLIQVLEEGRYIRRLIVKNGYSRLKVSEELGHLIQKVQMWRRDNQGDGASILPRLMVWCPKQAHNRLFDFCVHLCALPMPVLQSLKKHILSTRAIPSNQTATHYPLDDLGQQVREIRQRAEQAKRTLIVHNLRLVISIAWRYQDQGVEILDLYQEGTLGLFKAVDKFDYRQGNKFSTYATWWIRQSITRAIADQCRTIRLPVHMHEALSKIHGAEEDLTEKLGRKPSVSKIAEQCEMSRRRVKRALKREPRICSLDSLLCCSEFPLHWDEGEAVFRQLRPCPVHQYMVHSCMYGFDNRDDDLEYPPCIFGQKALKELAAEEKVDYSMLTLGASPSHKPSLDRVVKPQFWEDLERALSELTERERSVIEQRFGIADGQIYTLQEIGDKLGVTRERIRQIEAKALRKLELPKRSQRLREYL